jgi:hypothetical protein
MGNKYGQPLKRVAGEAALLAKARQLRDRGLAWQGISDIVGQSKSWLRYRLDPTFKEERNRQSPGVHHSLMPKGTSVLSTAELQERLSLVPNDTRDFTGRFCGDPIPHDRRRVG